MFAHVSVYPRALKAQGRGNPGRVPTHHIAHSYSHTQTHLHMTDNQKLPINLHVFALELECPEETPKHRETMQTLRIQVAAWNIKLKN